MLIIHCLGHLEAAHKPRLRRFLGLFWPLFDSFCGGSIRKWIQPPQKESKSGSKEPENRQKLSLWSVSYSFFNNGAQRYTFYNVKNLP